LGWADCLNYFLRQSMNRSNPRTVGATFGATSNALTDSVGKDDGYQKPGVPADGVIGCLAIMVFVLCVLRSAAGAPRVGTARAPRSLRIGQGRLQAAQIL
jgi:hypothetical protein